jgi:predicted outer membrane repeat protein
MKKLILYFFLLTCISGYAQTSVSGVVSGTWTLTGSPYLVQGALMIANGTTLTIEPGVTVDFQGSYKFVVLGQINAVGTATDSITFTATDTTAGWLGLRFDSTSMSNDTSRISYCKFLFGNANGNAQITKGGAIYFNYFSKANISYCRFFRCRSSYSGGALFCKDSSPNIIDNNFTSNVTDRRGSAIDCDHSQPLIKGNLFVGNYGINSVSMGGGIGFYNGCSSLVTNNVFDGNSGFRGASIFCSGSDVEITLNLFTHNTGTLASGVSTEFASPHIHHNDFIANDGNKYVIQIEGQHPYVHNNNFDSNISGVIICAANCTSIFEDNIITNNQGSGIVSWASSIIFRRNYVSNNAAIQGGAINCNSGGSSEITNNIFSNNTAYQSGGAIYCNGSSYVFANNTIVNNSADTAGAVYLTANSNPNFDHCIVWGNEANTGNHFYLYDELSDPPVQYSDIENGTSAFTTNANVFYLGNYTNNLSVDPLFVSPSTGAGSNFNGVSADFNLQANSPCIDAGGPTGGYSPTDIFGNPRVVGATIDMGAVEIGPNTSINEIANSAILYPNPANSFINIQTNTIYSSIEIYNIQMQKLYDLPFTQKVNISFLSNGFYFIKCRGKMDEVVSKILVTNY